MSPCPSFSNMFAATIVQSIFTFGLCRILYIRDIPCYISLLEPIFYLICTIGPFRVLWSNNMHICKNCNEETDNPKFCDRRCAAIYNNKKFPKRKKKVRTCKHCGKDITTPKGEPQRRTVCDDCNTNIVDWSIITIADMWGRRRYQKNSAIRTLAKRNYDKSDKPKCCIICRYGTHYEVCNIKSIKDFKDTALVIKVNSLDNLVALCRNHHWELDNGILNIEEIRA